MIFYGKDLIMDNGANSNNITQIIEQTLSSQLSVMQQSLCANITQIVNVAEKTTSFENYNSMIPIKSLSIGQAYFENMLDGTYVFNKRSLILSSTTLESGSKIEKLSAGGYTLLTQGGIFDVASHSVNPEQSSAYSQIEEMPNIDITTPMRLHVKTGTWFSMNPLRGTALNHFPISTLTKAVLSNVFFIPDDENAVTELIDSAV